MRNCHPSKRKQKKTSQEMGSFFFSRRKWFARLGTNSALACEWHTKNSCMTFLEFLTILSCSTHLSCSFAQLDYDFFVFFGNNSNSLLRLIPEIFVFVFSLYRPLWRANFTCRAALSSLDWILISRPARGCLLPGNNALSSFFFLFPIFFWKYYF